MIELILPAIITIIGNILFYIIIKGRIDKSIERNKIAYGGLFKEKVIIYRELLNKTFQIKTAISGFQYLGNKEEGEVIMQSVNDFIKFYKINQPFLSDKMLQNLGNLREEFQTVFDCFYIHLYAKSDDSLKKWAEAGNKLKENKILGGLEDEIVAEMREDLKLNYFNN